MINAVLTRVSSTLSRISGHASGSVAGHVPGHIPTGASALAVAVLVLGISQVLLGIVVQSWLCQAGGSALVVLAVSWAIKVLLPSTPMPPRRNRDGSPDRP